LLHRFTPKQALPPPSNITNSEVILASRSLLIIDPGVLWASAEDYLDEYIKQVETERTLHRNISPLQHGHNRSASDSVLSASQTEHVPRQSTDLTRKKAVIYKSVPLLFQDFFAAPSENADRTECTRLTAIIGEKLASYDQVIKINGKSDADDDDGFCKFVCGLPCKSRRKEEALLRTSDALERGAQGGAITTHSLQLSTFH
jgi:hypothetical protein